MQFKIIDTLGNDSVVEFIFDDGSTSRQTIAGVPLDTEENAVAFLTGYANAYVAGKATEAKTVDQSIIDKVLTPNSQDPVTGV